MEVGSFKKTLHDFIRESGWRSPKGVDEGLVGEVDVQITYGRFGVGLPYTPENTGEEQSSGGGAGVFLEGISPW